MSEKYSKFTIFALSNFKINIMIDSEKKDLIIGWLIEQFNVSTRFKSAEIAKKFEIHDSFVRLFLKQLQQKNMLEYSELGSGYVMCYPTMELYCYYKQKFCLKKNDCFKTLA